MAEKNLAQHIDKISYAVAGAVGIVLLVLPFVVGGNISEIRASVNVAAEELRQKKRTQEFPDLPKRTLKKRSRAIGIPAPAPSRIPRGSRRRRPVF